MNRALAIGAVAVCAAASAGVGLWLSRPAVSTRIDAADQALVAEGRGVYEKSCASCHGRNLEGQPNWRERLPNGRLPAPPHDPSGHTWHHPDRQLFDLTKNGLASVAPGYQSDMPAFKDRLSDREIRAALAYIKSTWPPEIRARQAQTSEADERAQR